MKSGTLRVSLSGSLKIANDFVVENGATAEINGLITADGGEVRISDFHARLRGSGIIAANTAIAANAILEPLGSGASTLTFQGNSILTLAGTATLLYAATLANANRVTITGSLADVHLPTGGGWKLKLQNPETVVPLGMTFVLFDGDDLGHRLNGNNSPGDDLVGTPVIDWGTTGWSLDPTYLSPYGSSGAGVHYDPTTNNIVLVGVIPEPGTASMLVGTCAAALGLGRFRRRS